MKTDNLDQPGENSHGITRGHKGRAAGSAGVNWSDAFGNEVTSPDAFLIGATVSEDDEGTAIIDLTGSGGSGTSGDGGTPYTNADAGAAVSLDLSSATIFDITLTANLTITFTDPPEDGEAIEWTIILRQGGVGGFTVTWPAAVSWQDSDGTGGGSAPTLFTAVDAVDVIKITTLDDGATYGGASVRGDFDLLLHRPDFDDLAGVDITGAEIGDRLRFDGTNWTNTNRVWMPLTTVVDGVPELVWEDNGLVPTEIPT